MLSPEEKREIDEELAEVPTRQAACIGAMKIIQKYRGWVSDEGLDDLSGYLGMSRHELNGVATFYNLIFRREVGKHVIYICDSVSCWLLNYEAILEHLKNKWKLEPGQTTDDGKFTLVTIPCLGLCDKAPAMIVDKTSYTELTPEKVDDILEKVDRE